MTKTSRPSLPACILALLLVAIAGTFLYFPVVKGNVGWYNSAEFNIAAVTLDVPHAPGYPLFTRMASLAEKYLPGASIALKVNLLTCGTGIAAAMLLTLLLLVSGCSAQAAALGGILLLAVPGFRDQSIVAEVYALEICLISLGLIMGIVLGKGNTSGLNGFFAGLIGAIGVGHRPTFGLYALTLIFFIWHGRENFKPGRFFWLSMLLGIFVGLLPSYDLYLRLQNPSRVLLDPLIGQGIDGFFQVFTGTVYSGGMFVFGPAELLARFLYFIRMVALEGGVWLLLGPLVFLMIRKSRGRALTDALVSILVINLAFVLNYNAFEAHTMLLPSFFSLAALAALAVEGIGNNKTRLLACFAVGSTALFCLSLQPATNDSPETYVKKALGPIAANSMVLMSNDVEFKPYWFYRLAEGFRKDLAIQLVDKFTSAELQTLQPFVEQKRLLGSLIYPSDSVFQLTASYSIAAEGYLHRVLPAGDWQAIEPHEMPALNEAINVAAQRSCWSETKGHEKDIRCPSDTFAYHYSFTGKTEDFARTAVVTIIVDSGGMTLARHGLLVGHDLHFPGSFLCRNGRPEAACYNVSRSIVLPEDIKPGKYKILMYAFTCNSSWPVAWLDFIPENVSIFNIDGFLEVFSLRYGLACRPLVRALNLENILTEPSFKPILKHAIELAEFRIQP